jgi:hypothetical protein
LKGLLDLFLCPKVAWQQFALIVSAGAKSGDGEAGAIEPQSFILHVRRSLTIDWVSASIQPLHSPDQS